MPRAFFFYKFQRVELFAASNVFEKMRLLEKTLPFFCNPYPAQNLVLEMSSEFYVCCIYSSALQTIFYHGTKHYEPWTKHFDLVRFVWPGSLLFEYALFKIH